MNVYVPQKGDILVPNALVSGAISQFQGFWAACGEAAASVVYAIQHGTRASAGVLDSFVVGLHAQGLASAQGTTSLGGIATALTQTGIQSTVIDNWRQALAQFTGSKPVVLLFQNGQALPGETPGLHGHFGTVVGYQPATNKFVVEDGNTPAARSGRFNLYSASQLAAAQPLGAVVPTALPSSGGAGIIGSVGSILGNLASGSSTPTVTNSQQAAQAINAIAAQGGQQFLENPVGSTLGVTGNMVGQGIALGFSALGNALLHALGVNSTRDAAFRLVLIVGGLVILIAGIRAVSAAPMQAASEKAQAVAPAVAAAAV